MRGLAGGGDDHLDAAIVGRFGPLVHYGRLAVGARYLHLVGHAHGVQLGHARLHGRHVRFRPHDNTHDRRCLCHIRVLSLGACCAATFYRLVLCRRYYSRTPLQANRLEIPFSANGLLLFKRFNGE